MENRQRFLIVLVSIALLIPLIISCKKGPEDPDFSFYSRKRRLCQDWKFSYYKKVEQNNQYIISYEFDGASLISIISNNQYISDALMNISFKKDGSYIWAETVSTDTSDYYYLEEGSWYFTGGADISDTKYKEMLALQHNKITKTLIAGGVTTTTNYYGTGNVNAFVYNILKLANDEIKLQSKTETSFIQISPNETDLKILTIEINLKKKL
jgi:hypothetical protein